MNLSKLILNPRSNAARNDLLHPYELHRTLKRAFPKGEPEKNRTLFRIEPQRFIGRNSSLVVLVQSSDAMPDWTHLPEDYCMRIEGPREFELALNSGQHLAFRLVANPIVKRKTGAKTEGGNFKHQRFGLIGEEDQKQWLVRQGEQHGFRLLYVQCAEFRLRDRFRSTATHKEKTSIPHFGVRYDGLLEVIEIEKLVEAVSVGIGPAKAFGFGLLSLSRPL